MIEITIEQMNNKIETLVLPTNEDVRGYIIDWDTDLKVTINQFSSIAELNNIAKNTKELNEKEIEQVNFLIENGLTNKEELSFTDATEILSNFDFIEIEDITFDRLENLGIALAEYNEVRYNKYSLIEHFDYEGYLYDCKCEGKKPLKEEKCSTLDDETLFYNLDFLGCLASEIDNVFYNEKWAVYGI